MEKFIIDKDIKTFGKTVAAFPAGINEAFKELIKATGDAAGKRNYYGVSIMDNNGKIIYKALAEEKQNGEAAKYNYTETIIEQGKYYFECVKNWRSQTNSINSIFSEMLKDEHVDKTKPAVEWYKNEDEMLCMLKAL